MTKAEAMRILRAHNEWRRGGEGEQTNPKQLGIALETAIRLLSTKRKPNSTKSVARDLVKSLKTSLRCKKEFYS